MTKPKIYMADEIWAGREYSPVEVPMGAEFVSKQDYDELALHTKAENKRITELEADLEYVRKTTEMQLEIIRQLGSELNLYRQALTRAVSLPKGQLPHSDQYSTMMLDGKVELKDES